MEPFELTYKLLTLCGVWRPASFSTTWDAALFRLYRLFAVPVPYLINTGLLARLILEELSLRDLSDTSFSYIVTSSICLKSYFFLRHQNDVINLSNMLWSKYSTPVNEIEMAIRKECYQLIRFITMGYIVLVWITASLWASVPLFQDKNHRSLPFPVWVPFNNSQDKIFWIIYVPEALGIFLFPTIAVGSDTIFLGFIILIIEQLNFLHHRLIDHTKCVRTAIQCEIPEYEIGIIEKKSTRQHVHHHLFILEFADLVCNTFRFILLTQFITSSMIISVSVFKIYTSGSLDLQLLQELLTCLCMCTELFIYCWFGNELIVKSHEFGDSILKIDWTVLSIQSHKKLLFMSLRAQNPIIMQIGHLIVLSLDSFIKILKVSYTAFNVLRN